MQATRTDVLVSLGSFIVSTGLLTSIAQRWGEVTGGSWPASTFMGLAASCILVLVACVFMIAFRTFKPLPKAPSPVSAPAPAPPKPAERATPAKAAPPNPETERDVLILMDFAVYQSTVLMLEDLLESAPEGIGPGPLQIGGDFELKNAQSKEFIELVRRKLDPGSHRRGKFEYVMGNAEKGAEYELEQTPVEQRPNGIDALALRKWMIAHRQCANAIGFLEQQKKEAEEVLRNQRSALLERYGARSRP